MLKEKFIKKYLKNNIRDYVWEDVEAAEKLSPGLWVSYTGDAILINEIDLDKNGKFEYETVVRWCNDEWDESPVFKNMRYPSYILEHFEKVDLENQKECPICKGKKRINTLIDFNAGGGDFYTKTKEEDCYFCEEFNKIKQELK